MNAPLERGANEVEWILVTTPDGRSLEVSKYPITVSQMARFIGAHGYTKPELWSYEGLQWLGETNAKQPSYWNQPDYVRDEKLPVTGVSFWEAQAVAAFYQARVPTEFEWWWIATNGGQTSLPWGEEPTDDTRVQSTFFGILAPGRLASVDAHPDGASLSGVCDLIGNTEEWCVPLTPLPKGEDQKAFFVLRGGSSWHPIEVLDPTFRDVMIASERDNNTSIRLVRGDTLIPSNEEVNKMLGQETNRIKGGPARSINRPTDQFRQEGCPTAQSLQDNWCLVIDGAVDSPRRFSMEEIKSKFEIVRERGFLVCVCKWQAELAVTGVRLFDVLDACKPSLKDGAGFLNFESFPGPDGKTYQTSWSVLKTRPHSPLLVFEFDNKPLTMRDGWPLRTLNWDIYGYKHVKAVHRMTVSTKAMPGHWESSRGYSFDGTIQPGTYLRVGDQAQKKCLHHTGRVLQKNK